MKAYKTVLFSCFVLFTLPVCAQGSAADSVEISDIIFTRVETEASYPGGVEAWRTFLGKNLDPNTPVENGAPVGKYTVIVQFVVDKNGTISNIEALTRHGYGMESEVIRIIKKSGAWSPAMQNKRPVKAYRKQPVTFMVTQQGFDIGSATPYVLFTRTDNEITVKAGRVKSEDLHLTISQGTISLKGGNTFIVKVNKPGRAVITVYGKKNKEIGQVNFEVAEPAE